LRILKVNQFD